jgi:hypothetical protein
MKVFVTRLRLKEWNPKVARSDFGKEGIHFSALVMRVGGNHAALAIGPRMPNVSSCA